MTEKTKNLTTVIVIGLFFLIFSVWCFIKPADALSESERRPLAALPTLDAESFFSGEFMQDFEDYTVDQFPLRDDFRTVKAVISFYLLGQKDMNGIYLQDGYAAQLEYPMNTDSLDNAAAKFTHIYEKYLAQTDAKLYLSVIPDKNCFMAAENGYPAMDYGALTAYLRQKTPFLTYIDIFPLLSREDYYKTDTHWRQEALTDVAQSIAQSMGTSLRAEYTVQAADKPFYGVYYGQSALPLPPDTLQYLTNDTLDACTVYDHETDSLLPVYDLEKAEGKDPYELFLSGSKSLLALTNPNADSQRRLIVFRDSFGSSLVPLLAEAYAEITLVDIRYLSSEVLDRFVDFENCDVLFLYSTLVLNNSVTLK